MSERKEALGALMETFDEMRGMTRVIAEQKDETLTRELPRPGLDTFGKHLAEMIAVEGAYVNALESGEVDLSTVPGVDDFEPFSGAEFAVRSEELAAQRRALLDEDRVAETCNWEGYPMSPASVIGIMIGHEAHHQGQMAAFMYTMEIDMPQTFASFWSLPPLSTD